MRPGKAFSVNQTLPSGPLAIPVGTASPVRSRPAPPTCSVISCVDGHMRPTRPGLPAPVNHSPPSLPWAMPAGAAFAARPLRYSLTPEPSVLMRPIAAGLPDSVK